ncbi:AMP-dependent synthetase [Actinomadura sp. CNU-125]|uniref:fatty acyl-AMP ligase n=1 Tax=Actinomadura sp. CNU-125 TaxID=1904961 RepID=UPI00095BEFB6|nr:fatty acyl-AMP ligase [Actinomadura sp. CNU-125]OLT20848.1 AMP-dependent synthetase [Actinomadura sp. CNU-125]
MRNENSLSEILQGHAADRPFKRAYAFLNSKGVEEADLSYGELHAKALAVARLLLERCGPGDRAILMFAPGLDFIVAYFGCLYAEIMAVPVQPPRQGRVQDATHGIVQDCAPSAVLTTGAMLDETRALLEPARPGLHWIAVDRTDDGAGSGFRPRTPSADAIAFLQYTSGSTSAPKGVMVSHRNLMANQEMIRRAFGHDKDSAVVGWAPFFHDQGLIGNVLQPLFLGSFSALMDPITIIRRPLAWLSAVSRYRAHSSGGPNFAFDACVARAAATEIPEMDLGCWKVAFNGAEPIRPATLRRFTETFAPYGFSEKALFPCYGLAEATLLVSGSGMGRGPRLIEADADVLAQRRYVEAVPTRSDNGSQGGGRILAGSGAVLPDEDVDLRIVDPETGRTCPPSQAGEIWVSGPHVALGYWDNTAATAQSFQAVCADAPGRTYLRTGDLGLILDGELYVVGRLKDLIIIRGRNHYPQDIEQTVQQAHPAIGSGSCAAFAVPAPDGERLVVVQEVRRAATRRDDVADIEGSIRAAVTREHQISAHDVVLAAPGQVHRTTSGKVMRSAAKRRYLRDAIVTWRSERTPTDT